MSSHHYSSTKFSKVSTSVFVTESYIYKPYSLKYANCSIYSDPIHEVRNIARKKYVIRQHIPQNSDHNEFTSNQSKTTLVKFQKKLERIAARASPSCSTTVMPAGPVKEKTCFLELDLKCGKKSATKPKKGKRHVKVQTDYRESSGQTSPWEPDYKVIQGDPELLKLDFLKWGLNLPVGPNEIKIIQRARMKRQWEKYAPKVTDVKSLNEKRAFFDAVSRDEWAFREKEIENIQQLRLTLLQNMLNELNEKVNCRNERKMRMFIDSKMKERDVKINKIHREKERELRRLDYTHKGIISKYGHVNVFEEHADFKSELYVPLLRHGNNPKYGHQELTQTLKRYKPQFSDVEQFNTVPSWLNNATKIKDIKLEGTRLCIRETKWTSPVLKKLHEELKDIRNVEIKYPRLRMVMEKESSELPTPTVEGCDAKEESRHSNCVFLQKILRGRMTQMTVFEGRERCRELIDELRSSFPLLRTEQTRLNEEKQETKEQQRDAMWCKQNMKVLEQTLHRLGGATTGTLLDFLNKELKRLLEERRIHATVMMIERLRLLREAAESGRRQLEIKRRQEHDEMFKQIVKVHQDSVDVYLQDIITEGMEFVSETEAREYVEKLAVKVDEHVKEVEEEIKDITYKEDYIASLVHNFVIPEVDKKHVREKNQQSERKFLMAAHNELYGTIETVQVPVPSSSYTDPAKHHTKKHRKPTEQVTSLKSDADATLDIQSILDDILEFPMKQSMLNKLEPCHEASTPDEYSSSSLSVEEEEMLDIPAEEEEEEEN